ncbi:MAG: universal stress protein [Acidimicrobiales bacterium]
MVERVLVAVDDSPAALGAARLAVDLARGWGASVRAITVLVDGALVESIQSIRPDTDIEARIGATGATVLAYTQRMADGEGITIEPVMRSGEPYRCILDEAAEWRADLIVMGRSDRKGPASPYVGSEVARVLEFADCPVLVVPQ